jgi:hypothetical protein
MREPAAEALRTVIPTATDTAGFANKPFLLIEPRVDEGTPLRLATSPIVILRFYAVDLKRTSSRNVDLREPVNDEVRGMTNDSGRFTTGYSRAPQP